jgi:hypothetical protein
MFRFNKTQWLAVSMAMLLVFAIGCSDDDNDGTTMAPDLGDGAMVRVVHASPDAPAVDVYAEGVAAPLISNLAYGQTSDYLDLAPGTYNIQLRAAGSSASSTPAFETGDLDIPDGATITAAAVGLLGSTDADDRFRVLPLVEGFVAPGAGNAAVRIIHGSADAPTVALDVGNDGAPEITGFDRFADTGAAGVPLPSGSELQIAVWAGSPLARVTVFTTPQLPEGGELFVFATGLLGKLPREDDGFSLLAVGPSGTIGFIKQNPVVFALHASPDAPPVDIYAGGSPLVTNLAFGALSGAIQVPPASYSLSFRATGTATEAASASTPTLAAGERYLAVATGFLGSTGSDAFTLIPLADSFTPDNTAPQVRVLHASPDAPAVDVGTVSGGQVSAVSDFTGLAYGDASNATGTVLPAGSLTIGVAAANDTDPVASFSIATSSDLRAFAVAAGSLLGNGESFRLVVVDTGVFPWTAAEVNPLP